MVAFEPTPESASGGPRQIREGLLYLAAKHVNVRYLQTPAKLAFWIKHSIILSNLFYLLFYGNKVRREGKVLAIDYSQRFHTLLLAMMMRGVSDRPIAIFFQACYFAYRTSKLKNLVDKKISKIFLRWGNIVFISGKALLKELEEFGISEERIRIIYPAIRDEFRKCVSSSSNGRRGKRDEVKVLWVGRVHPIKGLEFLVRAMASFRGMRNVRLMLVGDNNLVPWYTRKIVELIKETGLDGQVERRGRIEDIDRLARIYRDADIFVLPSLWDTSPIAVIEAMCSGLPVVGTTAGGTKEWIEDGVNGFLVRAGDVQGLTAAIGRLINDRELRERMGQASLDRSLRYRGRTWDDVGQEYYEGFLPLLNGQE